MAPTHCCCACHRTPWDKINVEFLVEETKKLAKEVKTLNKAVRNYEVYRLLEESLKAMLTSLPLVQVSTSAGHLCFAPSPASYLALLMLPTCLPALRCT
jgi:hypothetical protein